MEQLDGSLDRCKKTWNLWKVSQTGVKSMEEMEGELDRRKKAWNRWTASYTGVKRQGKDGKASQTGVKMHGIDGQLAGQASKGIEQMDGQLDRRKEAWNRWTDSQTGAKWLGTNGQSDVKGMERMDGQLDRSKKAWNRRTASQTGVKWHGTNGRLARQA